MRHSRLIAVLLVSIMLLSFVQCAFALPDVGPSGAVYFRETERPLPNGGRKTERELEVKPSVSGAKAGATGGAIVGAYFGPVGALVGAGIGGAIGLIFGPSD